MDTQPNGKSSEKEENDILTETVSDDALEFVGVSQKMDCNCITGARTTCGPNSSAPA
jgi:hypothetical protein